MSLCLRAGAKLESEILAIVVALLPQNGVGFVFLGESVSLTYAAE